MARIKLHAQKDEGRDRGLVHNLNAKPPRFEGELRKTIPVPKLELGNEGMRADLLDEIFSPCDR
jgi:hypothetical protein